MLYATLTINLHRPDGDEQMQVEDDQVYPAQYEMVKILVRLAIEGVVEVSPLPFTFTLHDD